MFKKNSGKASWLMGIFFVLAVMLAACGDTEATKAPLAVLPTATVAPTTAAVATTVAPTTAVAATTAKATTAVSTTAVAAVTTAKASTATTAATTTKAASTTAATATSGKIVIPASGGLGSDLAQLEKVLKATGNFNSVRIALVGTPKNDTPAAKAYDLKGDMVVVKPGSFSLDFTSSGRTQKIVVLDDKAYVSDQPDNWQEIDASTIDSKTLLAGFDQSHIETLTSQYAGSTVTYLPDEKLDGKSVGVIQLDVSTSTSDYAKQLKSAKVFYKYDKTTSRLSQFLIDSPDFALDTRYVDYDSASNKVVSPK